MCRHPVTAGGGSSSVNTGRVSPRGGVGGGKELLFESFDLTVRRKQGSNGRRGSGARGKNGATP
jgi:hypothetical protein